MVSRKFLAAALMGSAVAALAAPAEASMLMSYQDTAATGVTGNGAVNAFSGSVSTFYGDTFNSPQASPVYTSTGGTSFGFYDDFVFSVPTGVSADSITSSINLGNLLDISNLEVRLYNEAGNTPLPALGAPHGGAIEAWSSSITYAPGETGSIQVLDTNLSQPGNYVLEVRGTATGAAGGSYSGTLNITPVPIPAAFPLLLSGLGLLGGLVRRRVIS